MLNRQVGVQHSARLPCVPSHCCGVKISRTRAVVRSAVQEDVIDPEFNLSKAVVLGAEAFRAYHEPAPDKGIPRNQLDGTTMRFFDSKFVEEGYAGVLEITGISAKVVSASDWNSKSDVYITVSLGNGTARTSTKKNNEDPDFKGEALDIWVPKGKALDDITIAVFDDDFFRNEDDALGNAKFSLGSLRQESNTFELQMQGERSGDCVVTLTATFLPFGGSGGDKFLEGIDEAAGDKLAEAAPASQRGMQKSISEMGFQGSADLVQAWEELCGLYDSEVFKDKRTVAFITNEGSGTQCWISRDIPARKVLISFRGTEQTKAADLLADMDIRQTGMDLTETDDEGGFMQRMMQLRKSDFFRKAEPKVHSGFYRSWCSVRDTVMRTLDACTGGKEDWHVYVTGHSLGGALAILCAFELCNRESPDAKYPTTMYNYGGPRVGNTAFNDLYKVKDSWRVHNENDIVAQIPIAGMYGYRHVETGVRMLDDGSGFKFTNALNEDVVVEGGSGAKWSPRNMMLEIRETVEDAGELISKQKDVVSAIHSGEFVAAHMEDYYAEGLVNCMEELCEGDVKVVECSKRVKTCVARSRDKDEAPVPTNAS